MSEDLLYDGRIPSPAELGLTRDKAQTQDISELSDISEFSREKLPAYDRNILTSSAESAVTADAPITPDVSDTAADPSVFPNVSGYTSESPDGSFGFLKVSVLSPTGQFPVKDATVAIASTDAPDNVLMTLSTNISGQTEIVRLPAPPLAWSLDSSPEGQPYATYNITVTAPDLEPVLVSGSEIIPDRLSLQTVRMHPADAMGEEIISIPDHVLFGNYPAKEPEEEIKPATETGEIVLSRVVIPEYIIVHDGVPSDSSATNYWVRYKDYIKNVVSCEIYPTWPESTIYANILAIMSFTLNRVYTEWYRNIR